MLTLLDVTLETMSPLNREDRFQKWKLDLEERLCMHEAKIQDLKGTTLPTPTITQVFDFQWTCQYCQVTIGRTDSHNLDIAIYNHVLKYHDPSGINNSKSAGRNIKMSIGQTDWDVWILRFDNVVIESFKGTDSHSKAQKRMKDFL
jgi:hypothetical protein